jgi:hypothetical protein
VERGGGGEARGAEEVAAAAAEAGEAGEAAAGVAEIAREGRGLSTPC